MCERNCQAQVQGHPRPGHVSCSFLYSSRCIDNRNVFWIVTYIKIISTEFHDCLHLHSFIFVFDIQGMQSQRWPHLHSSLRGIPGIVSIPPCPRSLDATDTDTHLHLTQPNQRINYWQELLLRNIYSSLFSYILLYFDTNMITWLGLWHF